MSESFEKLQNRILSDARVRADEIIRDTEVKAGKTMEEARTKAQKEAAEVLSRARLEAAAVKRNILSSRVRENRLTILREKNLMLQEVLNAVKESLADIRADESFQDALKHFVTEAVEAVDTEEPVIRVGFREATKKDLESVSKTVPKGTKLVLEDEPVDELGGVVATDPGGKLVYNNSFRARIERMDSRLTSLISSTIFGEQ